MCELKVSHEGAGLFSPDLYTSKAVEIIQRHSSNSNTSQQPLFLYLAYQGNYSQAVKMKTQEISQFLSIFVIFSILSPSIHNIRNIHTIRKTFAWYSKYFLPLFIIFAILSLKIHNIRKTFSQYS